MSEQADCNSEGVMNLSEAILVGATMKPQAFRALFKDDGACACGPFCPAFGIITHRNDNHRWTREQIARWVASIEPEIGTPKRAPSRRNRHDHADYVGKTSGRFVEGI